MTLSEAIDVISDFNQLMKFDCHDGKAIYCNPTAEYAQAIEVINYSFGQIQEITEQLVFRKMSQYISSDDKVKSNHDDICQIYRIVKEGD